MEERIKGGATLWARQTIESEIFYYKPDKWFKIWFYIVNRVNHQDSRLFKRGTGLITYKDIMFATKATKAQVEKCIKWLEKEDSLDYKRTTRGRIRIVNNYSRFQELINYKKTKEKTKEKTSGRLAEDLEAVPIDKNEKNVKNDKKLCGNKFPLKGFKITTNKILMDLTYEDLNDGDITYESDEIKTPKKYKDKRKLMTRIAFYYLNLKGETGNVVRYFPEIKELIEKAELVEKPEKVEIEIRARILAWKNHQELKDLNWSLKSVITNWNAILNKNL